MSAVASPDLCKELHKVSGWEEGLNTELYVFDQKGKFVAHVNKESFSMDRIGSFVPAYDLGYLLRKLPVYPPMDTAKMTSNSFSLRASKTGWWVGYAYPIGGDTFTAKADEPEDAVANLLIQMFYCGILQKQ